LNEYPAQISPQAVASHPHQWVMHY